MHQYRTRMIAALSPVDPGLLSPPMAAGQVNSATADSGAFCALIDRGWCLLVLSVGWWAGLGVRSPCRRIKPDRIFMQPEPQKSVQAHYSKDFLLGL